MSLLKNTYHIRNKSLNFFLARWKTSESWRRYGKCILYKEHHKLHSWMCWPICPRRTMKRKQQGSWIRNQIKNCTKKRDNLYQNWIKNRTNENLLAIKKAHNQRRTLIKKTNIKLGENPSSKRNEVLILTVSAAKIWNAALRYSINTSAKLWKKALGHNVFAANSKLLKLSQNSKRRQKSARKLPINQHIASNRKSIWKVLLKYPKRFLNKNILV